MTGLTDYNFPAFLEAERYLQAQGWDTLSPRESSLRIGLDHAETRYHEYFRAAIELLLQADAVAFLPGFVWSEGAMLELALARKLRLKLYFLASDAKGLVDLHRAG